MFLRRKVRTAMVPLASAGVALSLLAACGGQSAGSSDEPTGSPELDALIAAAKQEGKVVYYSMDDQETIDRVTSGFKEAYGIDVVVQQMRGGEFAKEKLNTEISANAVQADAISFTLDTNWVKDMGAKGNFAALDPKELPNLARMSDNLKGTYFASWRVAPFGIFYNTDQIKESDLPASAADLPATRALGGGRLAVLSPTLGGGHFDVHYLLHQAMGQDRYEQFVNGLVHGLNAKIANDFGVAVSQVASGEMAAAWPVPTSIVANLIDAGAPAALHYLEPTDAGRISVEALAHGPHPHAAKLFLNWLIGKDGLEAGCGTGRCARPDLDVPGEATMPADIKFADSSVSVPFGRDYVIPLFQSVEAGK